MSCGPKAMEPVDSVIIPVAVLSLLVLSVAMMSYLFFFQPVRLFFEGEHAAAGRFFLSTVAAFACITGAVFAAVFFLNAAV